MSASPLRAVLFDLDGTLIDTAADLLGTLDDLRAELGLSPLAQPLLPAMAARGGRGILRLGFPEDPQAPERWLPRYLQIYSSRLARLSRPYPGAEALLQRLQAGGIALAIVSNKPEALARQLLSDLGWLDRFGSLIGGDTLPVRKPAADPVLRACFELGVPATGSVMVGDDLRDIEAARAAGCALAIAAAYGYLEEPESVSSWRADYIATSACDLDRLLQKLNASGLAATA